MGACDYVSILVREGIEEEVSKAGRYYDGEEDDATICGGFKPRVLEGGIGRLRLALCGQDSGELRLQRGSRHLEGPV